MKKSYRERYKSSLEEVRRVMGSFPVEDIERYVQQLERENYGLKTTNNNLLISKAKAYGYATRGKRDER